MNSIIDPRLKQLSYSSLLKLHSCPRAYELYKLSAKTTSDEDDELANLTFSTGHAVGTGVADVFLGKDEDTIIWDMFRAWNSDLLLHNPKQNKSFWLSVIAMQKLLAMRNQGFLSEWEVVTYQNKPAVELSFIINFPDGFVYRGFVDCVLRNTITGAIMVLECKTSSAFELSAAHFKNSAQAIGYSIVLDAIFPDISSYKVQYLIYRTKHMLYEPMDFTKSLLARAQWLKEMLLDIEMIKMYSASNVFPMHGESCRAWNRDCEYFNICTMSNTHITKPLDTDSEQNIHDVNSQFQISVTIQDLIDAQLAKEV